MIPSFQDDRYRQSVLQYRPRRLSPRSVNEEIVLPRAQILTPQERAVDLLKGLPDIAKRFLDHVGVLAMAETTAQLQSAIDRFNAGDPGALEQLFARVARRLEQMA